MFLNKITATLLLLLAFSSSAQDFQEDLNKVMQAMDTAKSVSLSATVSVYTKKGSNSFFSAKASLQKNANASWTVLDDQEYYSNASYFVSVDHDERKVSVIRNDDKKNSKAVKGLDIDMKEFRKLLAKEGTGQQAVARLVSSQEAKRVYAITNVPSMKEIRITLDMKRLSISGLTYEYKEDSEYKGQYIVISYTGFSTSADVTSSLKQSNFFTISGGKALLSNRYKGYTLHTEL